MVLLDVPTFIGFSPSLFLARSSLLCSCCNYIKLYHKQIETTIVICLFYISNTCSVVGQ